MNLRFDVASIANTVTKTVETFAKERVAEVSSATPPPPQAEIGYSAQSVFEGVVAALPGVVAQNLKYQVDSSSPKGLADTAMHASAATEAPRSAVEATVARVGADAVIDIAEFGSLMRSLGEDLIGAKTKEQRAAIMERANRSMHDLYGRADVVPDDAAVIQAAMAKVPELLEEHGPESLIAFGQRFEQLQRTAPELPSNTFGAVMATLSDKVIHGHELSAVLRAIVKDLSVLPRPEAAGAGAAAVDFIGKNAQLDPRTADQFTAIYLRLRSLMHQNMTKPQPDLAARLTQFANEFDALKQ